MAVQPTRQQIEACARLKFNEAEFVNMLKQRIDEYHSNMVTQREELQLRWAQGRLQETKALLDLIENSHKYLNETR